MIAANREENSTMNSKGLIDPNFDALDELFRAVLSNVSSKQARLAIWTIEAFDLSQFDYQPIGAESPFLHSSSILAGSGFLLSLQSSSNELIDVLCDRLTYEILHLEIEVEGDVQFAAYDHFGYVVFGNEFPLPLLETLKTRGVIYSYDVFDAQKTIR